MSDNNTGSIYTNEEIENLDKISKARFSIIDSMTESGPPQRSRDIRVLNEVLSSADKMINDAANTRIKHSDNANSGAVVDIVVELLKQSRATAIKNPVKGGIPTIDSKYSSITTVPGETDIDPDRLDPTEFVSPVFNASKASG